MILANMNGCSAPVRLTLVYNGGKQEQYDFGTVTFGGGASIIGGTKVAGDGTTGWTLIKPVSD
jgi:hypothetical protein